MSDDNQKDPQWLQAANAVEKLGMPASVDDIWEQLKKARPDIPRSTIGPDLDNCSVNARSRTSYPAGKEPRQTDAGNRYDRLFKVGEKLEARYVPYDKNVHGVWEIYADPTTTSTHKTSIRKVEPAGPTMTIMLTDGAVKTGNTFLPVNSFDERLFPSSMVRAKNPDAPAIPARFATDAGTEFDSDLYRSSPNAGYLHNRSAAGTYYRAKKAKGGDVLSIERKADGSYYISLRPIVPKADADDNKNHGSEVATAMTQPVNKILFGPPGTGKTYCTVNEALRILDAPFLAANNSDRSVLKQRFDALLNTGQIRFVTFHQSFSYEDFVEGIRASTDETTGALRYEVEDGVFKQICEAARSRTTAEAGSGIDVAGRKIWKISLGDANTEGHVFDECMEKGIALMGFGFGADLTGVSTREDILERVHAVNEQSNSTDYAITALDQFILRMKEGDLIVVTHGNVKFRAIGEVTGGYQHIQGDSGPHYVQARPVRWLRQYDPPRPYADLMENRFSQMTIYQLRSGKINLDRLAGLLAPEQAAEHEPEARVLIIDEINRGNVSRIFGELITLIEPSKREGCDEALEVTLPYSKERFSVPRNVHLIGTMNTADRSLAGLDVALRRRFEFVEMLPDIETLSGIVVEGVPVGAMLSAMNRRIEVLLGRDYMLGHAYFLGLREFPSLSTLADVFRRQVLPLLQEYFFENWQKIAWVLNDHRKPASLQFLQQVKNGMAELLGDDVELPGEGRIWTINVQAFDRPEAYLSIIKADQGAA